MTASHISDAAVDILLRHLPKHDGPSARDAAQALVAALPQLLRDLGDGEITGWTEGNVFRTVADRLERAAK